MAYKNIWARIAEDVVAELFFEPDDGFTMADRFPPDLIWVDVTNLDPRPDQGWIYKNGVFSEPEQPVAPTPEPPDVDYSVPPVPEATPESQPESSTPAE